MEEPTALPPIPDSGEPRYCPVCGSRVADLATTCLMCGASLDVEEEALEDAPQPRFRIPWGGLFAGILTALAFLALVGWLVRAQIVGSAGTPTPSLSPTVTLPPTSTPKPTETPSPTPTATPVPPQVHQVQSGETCVSVAVAYDITLDQLVALNPEKCGPGGIIRPADLLLIPAATSTPGPTVTVGPGTPSPTPECPILHVVQPGEAGLVIADKYGVPFDLVITANPQVDFEKLQVNQVLQIPCGTPVPTPTPTRDPNATPTPIPKYAAPALLSPPNGARLTGSLVPLQWTAVSLLRDDEQYALRLRRVDKSVPVETIMTRTTLVRLGGEYAPSPEEPERAYSWEVTVVRSAGTSVTGLPRFTAASQPSAERTFQWFFSPDNATPGVTPGP
jgi:LysM repeat protein